MGAEDVNLQWRILSRALYTIDAPRAGIVEKSVDWRPRYVLRRCVRLAQHMIAQPPRNSGTPNGRAQTVTWVSMLLTSIYYLLPIRIRTSLARVVTTSLAASYIGAYYYGLTTYQPPSTNVRVSNRVLVTGPQHHFRPASALESRRSEPPSSQGDCREIDFLNLSYCLDTFVGAFSNESDG
jgi:hypothetical protein